jgi:hypothetical protein
MWTFAKGRVEFRGHSFVLLFLCSARCEVSVEISQRSTPVSNQLQRTPEIRPNFFRRGGPGPESVAPRPGIFRMPAYLAKVHQMPATGCLSCPLVPTPDLGSRLNEGRIDSDRRHRIAKVHVLWWQYPGRSTVASPPLLRAATARSAMTDCAPALKGEGCPCAKRVCPGRVLTAPFVVWRGDKCTSTSP